MDDFKNLLMEYAPIISIIVPILIAVITWKFFSNSEEKSIKNNLKGISNSTINQNQTTNGNITIEPPVPYEEKKSIKK